MGFFSIIFLVNFHFFSHHIHHITCTEQDTHIISVNDSYCYLCAQHITTFFLKSIVIVILIVITYHPNPPKPLYIYKYIN